MIYKVYIWLTDESFHPDILAMQDADDPLDAVYMVMRRWLMLSAYAVTVYIGQDFVAGYSEVVCPQGEALP